MADTLTELQTKVVTYALAEEGNKREHLVVSLSGAHAYGFASENSDVDLKAIHVAPTADFLGLSEKKQSFDRLETIDGVEIDYTSNEIALALRGVLAGGGNMIERIMDPKPLFASKELPGLQEVVSANLSIRLHHHYRGFATSQAKALGATPKIKSVLYVLRTALTGAHALETGKVVADLSALADDYGFPEARGLIAMKRADEGSEIPPSMRSMVPNLVERAFARLEKAREKTILPEEARDPGALERWLVALRVSKLST